MRIALSIIGFIATLVGVTYFVGKSLPEKNEVVVETSINASAEKVWSVMTSWEDQPLWRSGIDRVEIIDSSRFVEYPKSGAPIEFEIMHADPPRLLEMAFSGAVNGTYVAELTEDESVTRFRSTESVSIANPFFRVINALFIDLEEFANNYQSELKIQVENNL
ncbi:SRPBCC family protein [Halomonas sp. ML-15]|uniref:SRPBCC family protein n=1 Tax=Halomonas sp. ML-15 TaxID=2773305 RepID=UPI00174700FC|nr:SRPBCC family protein [Halomonas sp. ML-15]MBD3896890.1 SRPBCC family protein [Halomonas sp. ML-15]